MLVAKHYPGQIASPYVHGMNVGTAQTGLIRSAITINSAISGNGSTKVRIGTDNFTLIMYCPVLSAFYSGNATVFNGNKVGGLIVK